MPSPNQMFTNLVAGLAWILLLISSVSFLGRFHWFFDLLTQFRIIYFVLGLLVCFILLGLKRRALAVTILLVVVLINASQIWPQPTRETRHAAYTVKPIRILQSNLWASNQNPQRLLQLIQTEKPDIITLEELTSANRQLLNQSKVMQPYSWRLYQTSGRIGLYSRFPMSQRHELFQPALIEADAQINGHTVTMMLLHMGRPIGPHYAREIQNLKTRILQSQHPVILSGDFNTGPWSFLFQDLLTQTHLQNSQSVSGIAPTYPVHIPKTQIEFPFPVLPIDHVLANPKITVLQRHNGPQIGSDHLPVIIDLLL